MEHSEGQQIERRLDFAGSSNKNLMHPLPWRTPFASSAWLCGKGDCFWIRQVGLRRQAGGAPDRNVRRAIPKPVGTAGNNYA